jgi:LytS/YehU family sensor histidine kinase
VKSRGGLDPVQSGTGLGLKNARARLALLFGPDASLTLAGEANRVVAQVRIPSVRTASRT